MITSIRLGHLPWSLADRCVMLHLVRQPIFHPQHYQKKMFYFVVDVGGDRAQMITFLHGSKDILFVLMVYGVKG